MEGNAVERVLPPVHRLPPELLAHVFRELQLSLGWSWIRIVSRYFGYESTVTWIRITWTCRYWRLVALECPQLWTLIVVKPNLARTWAPTFLERSRGMPLTMSIETYIEIEDTQPILDVCLPHAHRLRRLDVEGPLCHLLVPSTRRFDVLEELYVMHYRRQFDTIDVPTSCRTLHLCSDNFRRLQTLKIQCIDIKWKTFSLMSLHELELRNLPFGIYTTSILQILQNFPELRGFVLGPSCTIWLPSGAQHWANTMGPVSLAHINRIDLSDRPWTLAHVLDNVIVPSGYFHISLDYYGALKDARDLSIDPLEMILPRHLVFRSLLPHCTILALTIHGGMAIISASDRSQSCSLVLNIWGELFFNAPGAPILTEAIWISFLDAFAPSPLSHFCLEYPNPQDVTTNMWTALFGRFSLDSVEARFSGSLPERGSVSLLENLFAALSDRSAHRVRTLELVFLALTLETVGEIMDLLGDRASMDAPLERLVFVACFCESSLDVAALKTRLESSVDISIWYEEDTDTPEDEFRTYDEMTGPSDNAWWTV